MTKPIIKPVSFRKARFYSKRALRMRIKRLVKKEFAQDGKIKNEKNG